uniref:NADH-ubiquinone oxidoreductase chain 1 n=1 Tax=Scorpiops tibetanus TaxID=500600 RepID=A0A7M3UTW1_SCOTI|nr:NADH dehydrogenase subunit 1 [Scorpiops tibetanus]QOJ45420.1 NADH dehydrogenase subunit 1 [Scorpiops tibetanus]
MLTSIICYILTIIMILISVAFLTLLERKFLGYIQIRKGPNKVGILGILQPFSDAIKLFTKEHSILEYYNFVPFFISPIFGFMVALLFWAILPSSSLMIDMKLGIIFFLCCSSFGVYTILGAGWASNSKYASLGAYRGVAQTISYEVSFALILLSICILISSFNFMELTLFQMNMFMFISLFPLFLIWFVSCLAETNRSPFDFSEGESELVSGFNIEYMSGGFALIFLAEYMNIILMSIVTTILFFGLYMISIKATLFSLIFIWVRGSFPRFRYDKLMMLAWKSYLPLSLNYIVISMMAISLFNAIF